MPKSYGDRRHLLIVGVLVIVGTIIIGVLLNAVLPMPVAAAFQASTIDWLFGLHMWLIAFLFSLVVVIMLYSMVIFRRRKGDESEGDHFEGNTTLEVIWTVVPLILVVIFGFIGIRTLNEVSQSPNDAEVVKVTGFQWAWSFEYTNGATSVELMLPVDTPITMEMTSSDVIHSFWVPEFRVKQDLVPGMTTHVSFTTSRIGEYQLRCAELCGLTHWGMRTPVKVVSQEEYTAWLDETLAAQNRQTASQ